MQVKNLCKICGQDHEAHLPHDAESIYYREKFFKVHGRYPTWDDAMAHCSPGIKIICQSVIKKAV